MTTAAQDAGVAVLRQPVGGMFGLYFAGACPTPMRA